MKYNRPEDLPYSFNEEMNDLWTVFISCPIERGSIEVYSAFVQARELAFNAYKNKNAEMEM